MLPEPNTIIHLCSKKGSSILSLIQAKNKALAIARALSTLN
jgi:hypothetical protein